MEDDQRDPQDSRRTQFAGDRDHRARAGFFSHSESVNVETEKKLSAAETKRILREAPGVIVADEPENNVYPTPIDATGKDATYVGRIREDDSVVNGLNLWVVADNLRKGAALNAVQIAEILIRDYL